jgi:hypothetical protein
VADAETLASPPAAGKGRLKFLLCPPCVCFFPPFWTLWHRASIALAPSCGVGTSRLERLSVRAGSHARQPFLDAS